jgi:hypothetical protein
VYYILLILFNYFSVIIGSGLETPSSPFVDLTVLGGDSIRANFSAGNDLIDGTSTLVSDGGSAIHSYKVEWDSDPGIQEIQSITTSTDVGVNEVQTIATTTSSRNEIQKIRTTTPEFREVQKITLKQVTDGSYFFLKLDTTAIGGSVQFSGDIQANAEAESERYSVRNVISAMTNIKKHGEVEVSKTVVSNTEYYYLVTFPPSMGNVPTMEPFTDKLLPQGEATATVTTENGKEGNIIGGTFRLSFGGYTTVDIPYDASPTEMREALETLPGIETVDVSVSTADNQRGYEWTVEFTGAMNDGNVETLKYDRSGLAVSNSVEAPDGVQMTVSPIDGNQLGGSFKLAYKHTDQETDEIPYNADAATVKNALEKLDTIPKGTVAVSRSGPSGELEYTWTVTFLTDFNRTHEGDLELIIPNYNTTLTGDNSVVTVAELKNRKGTIKEVQQIGVILPYNDAINTTTMMKLQFRNQSTVPIYLYYNGTTDSTCSSAVTEVQTITSSTVDRVGTVSQGDSEVSTYLQFRIKYSTPLTTKVTDWIYANPSSDPGNCDIPRAMIESELEKFSSGSFSLFDDVVVNAKSTGVSMGCTWTLNFVSSIGDIQLLQVESKNLQSSNYGIMGYSSTAGDDTISIVETQIGAKDAIKAALEDLDTIGTVTVHTEGSISAKKECTWTVTFDTNAGSLPLLQASVFHKDNETSASPFSINTQWSDYNNKAVQVLVTRVTESTSAALSGYFALTFRGSRTGYLRYDDDAYKVERALESIDTIGDVSVTRSIADENNGYTWSVTFLTELGDVPNIIFDDASLEGTVAKGVVSEARKGITPPFNSLDQANGLPLGSAVITDLANLGVTVSGLEQGVAYYFRVAAVNAVGQGPFSFSSIPYAIPQPQRPGMPESTLLQTVDSTSLLTSFESPELDGGEDVTSYRVEYATKPFVAEVQRVSARCNVTNEVQVVSTHTSSVSEVQLVHIRTSFNGTSVNETQKVICDADGGYFKLNFDGSLSNSIKWTASMTDIKIAIEAISTINDVEIEPINGASQACTPGNIYGFSVTFKDITGWNGNLPNMTAVTTTLTGQGKTVIIDKTSVGSAGIGGTFRLQFRGSSTEDIPVSATALQMTSYLTNIDTIAAGGVTVNQLLPDFNIAGGEYDRMWSVTFASAELGGDVETLQVPSAYNHLTGSDIQIDVHNNGLETSNERRSVSIVFDYGKSV